MYTGGDVSPSRGVHQMIYHWWWWCTITHLCSSVDLPLLWTNQIAYLVDINYKLHLYCDDFFVCRTFLFSANVAVTCKNCHLQVNIAVFNVNLGGVFNCLAYTFVRRRNSSGKRQDKRNTREQRQDRISGSNSTSVSSLSKYEQHSQQQ